MARSHKDIEAALTKWACELASKRVGLPATVLEYGRGGIVVRAGRKRVTYEILRRQACDEDGTPFLGGDRYEPREVEVKTIPVWQDWFGTLRASIGSAAKSLR